MKASEQEKIEKMEKLTAEFDSHPMTQALRAEKAAEILAKRQAAADKIKDLELELEATRVFQREIDDLALKLAELDAERETIRNAINQKRGFMMREKSGIEGEIRQQQEILTETSDSKIDETIQFFRDKLDELRKPGRICHNAIGSEKNIFTEKVKVKAESNVPAINSALEYCRAAIKELETMKLSPAVDFQKIEEMKKGIPDINVYTEYQGEKPMEKGPDIGFLAKMRQALDDKTAELLGRRVGR